MKGPFGGFPHVWGMWLCLLCRLAFPGKSSTYADSVCTEDGFWDKKLWKVLDSIWLAMKASDVDVASISYLGSVPSHNNLASFPRLSHHGMNIPLIAYVLHRLPFVFH